MSLRELFYTHRLRIQLIIRYGISGVCGAFLQTTTLYVWVSVLGFKDRYLWGVVIGFCFALLITFFLQKHWTFREHSPQTITKQLSLYTGIALMSLVLNALFLHGSKQLIEGAGLSFFHGWYLVAQIIIIGIVSAFSFLLNYFITFTTEQKET